MSTILRTLRSPKGAKPWERSAQSPSKRRQFLRLFGLEKHTLVLVKFLLCILFGFSVSFSSDRPAPKMKEIIQTKKEASPNFREGKFRNQPEVETTTGSYWGMIQKWMGGDETRSPDSALPIEKIDTAQFFSGIDSLLTLSWIGHSTLLIELEDQKILTDPIFSQNSSPVPWLYSTPRFQEKTPLSLDELPSIDVVLISHDHFDHLGKEAVVEAHPKIKRFFVPLGVEEHLLDWGVPAEKIQSFDWGDSAVIGGVTYVAEQAQHFSGRSVFFNRTLWASWIVKGKVHKIFYSGDSGFHSGFTRIGNHHGPFDLTLLDCAQYGEYWKTVHMFPEEAVTAHKQLQGRYLMPVHWGTFSLAYHDWWEPVERLLAAAGPDSIAVLTPMPGEKVVLDSILPQTRWWETYKTKTD